MKRWILITSVLFTLVPSAARAAWPVVTGYMPTENATYYGYVADEYEMACSWNYPAGTVIEFWDGTQRTCLDRGDLDTWDVTFDFLVYSESEARYVQSRYSGMPFTVVCWGYC
jgi:hypothetical protein